MGGEGTTPTSNSGGGSFLYRVKEVFIVMAGLLLAVGLFMYLPDSKAFKPVVPTASVVTTIEAKTRSTVVSDGTSPSESIASPRKMEKAPVIGSSPKEPSLPSSSSTPSTPDVSSTSSSRVGEGDLQFAPRRIRQRRNFPWESPGVISSIGELSSLFREDHNRGSEVGSQYLEELGLGPESCDSPNDAAFFERTSWLFDRRTSDAQRTLTLMKRAKNKGRMTQIQHSEETRRRRKLCSVAAASNNRQQNSLGVVDMANATMTMPPSQVTHDPEKKHYLTVTNVCIHPRGGLSGFQPRPSEGNLGPLHVGPRTQRHGPGWFDRPDESGSNGFGLHFTALGVAPTIKKSQYKSNVTAVVGLWGSSFGLACCNIYHLTTKALGRLSLYRRLRLADPKKDAGEGVVFPYVRNVEKDKADDDPELGTPWASEVLRMWHHFTDGPNATSHAFGFEEDLGRPVWSLFDPRNSGHVGGNWNPRLEGSGNEAQVAEGRKTVESDLMCFKRAILGYDGGFAHENPRLPYHFRLGTAFRQQFKREFRCGSAGGTGVEPTAGVPGDCGLRNTVEKRVLFQPELREKMPDQVSDEMLFGPTTSGAAAAESDGQPQKKKYKMVIITRAEAGRRVLLGRYRLALHALETFRDQLVVQMVFPERLSIQQQIKVFASADILLGVHGAGLTWSFLLPRNAVVIELTNYYQFNFVDGVNQNCETSYYGPVCAQFGINHIMYFSPDKTGPAKGRSKSKGDRDSHLSVQKEHFASIIETAFCVLDAKGDRVARARCELDTEVVTCKSCRQDLLRMWAAVKCDPSCDDQKRAIRDDLTNWGQKWKWKLPKEGLTEPLHPKSWASLFNDSFVRYDARYYDKCIPVLDPKLHLPHPSHYRPQSAPRWTDQERTQLMEAGKTLYKGTTRYSQDLYGPQDKVPQSFMKGFRVLAEVSGPQPREDPYDYEDPDLDAQNARDLAE